MKITATKVLIVFSAFVFGLEATSIEATDLRSGKEKLMAVEPVLHTDIQSKGEKELVIIDPIHYRTKRFAVTASKYLLPTEKVEKYLKQARKIFGLQVR